jgi:hypothetical protein
VDVQRRPGRRSYGGAGPAAAGELRSDGRSAASTITTSITSLTGTRSTCLTRSDDFLSKGWNVPGR